VDGPCRLWDGPRMRRVRSLPSFDGPMSVTVAWPETVAAARAPAASARWSKARHVTTRPMPSAPRGGAMECPASGAARMVSQCPHGGRASVRSARRPPRSLMLPCVQAVPGPRSGPPSCAALGARPSKARGRRGQAKQPRLLRHRRPSTLPEADRHGARGRRSVRHGADAYCPLVRSLPTSARHTAPCGRLGSVLLANVHAADLHDRLGTRAPTGQAAPRPRPKRGAPLYGTRVLPRIGAELPED
jgi:hypothetical protein